MLLQLGDTEAVAGHAGLVIASLQRALDAWADDPW